MFQRAHCRFNNHKSLLELKSLISWEKSWKVTNFLSKFLSILYFIDTNALVGFMGNKGRLNAWKQLSLYITIFIVSVSYTCILTIFNLTRCYWFWRHIVTLTSTMRSFSISFVAIRIEFFLLLKFPLLYVRKYPPIVERRCSVAAG